MSKYSGTISRGIKCPIIKKGDDLVKIVTDSIVDVCTYDGVKLNTKDVIGITESIVARAQGNYATVDDIAKSVNELYGTDKDNLELSLLFPIYSRNRFSILLKGIARACKKIYLFLGLPADEVGNHLVPDEVFYEYDFGTFMMTEKEYREKFGYDNVHPFTGVDYVTFYKEIIEKEDCKVEVIFTNNPKFAPACCSNVLTCDIHTIDDTKYFIDTYDKHAYGKIVSKVYSLKDILNKPINGSGYNSEYGLLGSNKATEDTVKLFPRDCTQFVKDVQTSIFNTLRVWVEVMVYGDGAFKDPVGKIWELADPVVSPGYTDGLVGTPNELKLKYLADNSDKTGEALADEIKEQIKNKDANLKGKMSSQGTTPRQYTDLLGSLCDLTSGSGDKGTPIVLIQNYFNNYSD